MSAVQSSNNDAYASDEDPQTTNEFRKIFKKYKKRVPPPDFSNVIDVRNISENHELGIKTQFLQEITKEDEEFCDKYGFKNPKEWLVTTFEDRPGLFVLPSVLRKSHTADWAQKTFDYALPPNTTNLTIHGTSPTENPLRTAGKSLRWTTLGIEYNWVTKEYPKTGSPLPEELRKLAEVVCRLLHLPEMSAADATIVNYYPPKSTLSPHVDRSERSTKPLVSLSIGQPAVYLTGGRSLEEPPIPIWLRNGDVLVMHGEQRFVYHAVPCVAPNSQRESFVVPESTELEAYLNTSRVNLTIRQVNV